MTETRSIYGHYMYNGTMFNELEQYHEKSFWEKYPSFYIYTPDGNSGYLFRFYSVWSGKRLLPKAIHISSQMMRRLHPSLKQRRRLLCMIQVWKWEMIHRS